MPNKEKEITFNPDLDMFPSMAQYLGEKLHIRPADILDTWSIPELIVTYGTIANEESKENFARWKELDPKTRVKYPRPEEYRVYFMGEI